MENLNEKINFINQHLESYLPKEETYQKLIFEAMRYSVFAGGKRLRPILMMGAYEAIGGKDIKSIMPFACAIEMIHTYSLIHDDLPAMDNDDYRRGKLTNHKVFGDGIAILAGDALLNFAYELMLKSTIDTDLILKSMKTIAHASGVYGMIGGQVVDLESEHKSIDKDTLLYIQQNKTAALIQAPLKVGAIIANADEKTQNLFEEAGYNLGIAFQIQDDILDITGDEANLGKSTKSDLKNEKATFVSVYGLEEAISLQKKYSNKAIEIFSLFNDSSNFLVELTRYLIYRNK